MCINVSRETFFFIERNRDKFCRERRSMAAYVKMIKKYEDNKKVIYLFRPDEK